MTSRLCLLLLFSPSLLIAQESAAPKWTLGMELGYTGMYAYVDDLPVTALTTGSAAGSQPSIAHDKGGEGIVAVHLGKPMNRFLRTDAYLSMNLVGVGLGEGTALTASGGTYTTVRYDGAESSGFLSTGLRLVAENRISHSTVRPRASLTAAWQWTKGPAAALSAGISTGSQTTRFTVDAGEQFTWLRFHRRVRTYEAQTNTLISDDQINGSKRLSGFSVRIGIDHYVF